MTYLKRDAREEQLLEIAVGLLSSKGYRATTTRDIAREGGVATGNISRLFGSLSALKQAALYRINDRIVEEYEAASAGQTPLEGVLTLLGDPTDSRNQHVLTLWREVAVLAAEEATLRDIHQHALRSWALSVARYISEHIQHFRVRDTPERTAWRLIAFITGMDLLQEMGAMSGSYEEMKHDLVRFIRTELINDEVK
ncbi:TetR family transcriptional regulator [Siccibacter colletis]|uniref:TetR family transcriptional regulator n=1 Tax=Siccibacter colletis TaxID=1505757 RepID=UPI0004E25D37|nr:TetR family transcriptional regulator [Siccibacter colletis]